ncbi:hypothetical protein ALC60_01958 [Trachymyrmex zeteki]|uniref:Uncharacterized protein n=1 Tax=Mycetomoellerius zeteki TaxID=64791 RepID=A0A151XF55_9HYME|nr:hypothetical protein ALC60_01958 [Trachymyrmex zeteki]
MTTTTTTTTMTTTTVVVVNRRYIAVLSFPPLIVLVFRLKYTPPGPARPLNDSSVDHARLNHFHGVITAVNAISVIHLSDHDSRFVVD